MRSATFVQTGAAGLLLAALIVGCSKDDQLVGSAGLSSLSKAATTQSGNGTLMPGGNDERTRLEGKLLADGTAASGRARWEMRPDRMRFNVQVEDVPSSGAHEVRVNGTLVTTVNVSGGRGEVELDSRDGKTVPKMLVGDLVEVFNPDNELVVSGYLQPR